MSAQATHTPGPWRFEGGDNWSMEIGVGRATCFIDREEKNTDIEVASREEMEANAHLIAAAPELLEALETAKSFVSAELCHRLESCGSDEDEYIAEARMVLEKVDAAIGKAKGGQQ